MTTDNTQELDEILVKLSTEKQKELVPYIGRTIKLDDEVLKAKQAILDWHNKQTEALLNEMLVDVSSPNANIDQAEMIELINLYINKLKEGNHEQADTSLR